MNILHVADLHPGDEWFEYLLNRGDEYDLLVIAGDLQNAFSHRSMRDQVAAILRRPERLPVPTIVCSRTDRGMATHSGGQTARWGT